MATREDRLCPRLHRARFIIIHVLRNFFLYFLFYTLGYTFLILMDRPAAERNYLKSLGFISKKRRTIAIQTMSERCTRRETVSINNSIYSNASPLLLNAFPRQMNRSLPILFKVKERAQFDYGSMASALKGIDAHHRGPFACTSERRLKRASIERRISTGIA